jgi:2-polyprenyl-6-hydroxyphenyl methylase/3-demethylubiquinone-9 3-methyltransferase
MHRLGAQMATLPEYSVFQMVCNSGLSKVRPLREAAAAHDEWGWNFGSGWPPSYFAYGRMRALTTLLEAVALNPKRVLEVAAGDAALCACLASRGFRVVANDLRGEHLTEAVASFTNGDDIQLLPGDLFQLDPAETGLFDLVVACEIVEHVAHTVEFLAQLKRFVAPGGHLLLTTPNGSYFRNKLPTHSEIKDFRALESQQFQPDADGHLFLITPGEMVNLAHRAGLAVERMTLWATPLVTGHVGLSRLASSSACWACYQFEKLVQKLPFAIKERACFNLSVVLAPLAPNGHTPDGNPAER